MTRRKSIFKILSAVLAVLLLAVTFAGCGEYKPPENTGGTTPGVTPTPGPSGDPDDPDEDYYTVSLVFREVVKEEDENGDTVEQSVETPFTVANYSAITGLQAQWTEITDGRAEVYRASFDKNGVAKVSGLAGDFNVTLVLTDDFRNEYTYDPNPARPERRDELVATRYKKDVSVPMYKIKELGKSAKMWIGGQQVTYYPLTQTGAYKYELTSRTDKQMFMYRPPKSGEYSFMTLMDVTADEINPIVDLHNGNSAYISPYPSVIQDGGGAEGKYTKNVWLKYQLDKSEVGNVMIFNLHSESEKPDAYPLTIYFIFERDGEYTKPKVETSEIPITEDFTKTPKKPNGDLQFVSESPLFGNARRGQSGKHILNQKSVKYYDPKDGGDGYYYFIDAATGDFYREADGSVSAQYRIYAVITKPIPVLRGMAEGGGDASLSYGKLAVAFTHALGSDGIL